MYRAQMVSVEIREVVDRLPYHVEKAALHLIACRHRDRTTEILHLHTTAQAVGALHGDTPYSVFADVLLNFKD